MCPKYYMSTILILTLVSRLFAAGDPLRISWDRSILTLSADHLPGRDLKIHYIEAYCRPGSTNRKWDQTTIGHTTRLVSLSEEQTHLILECTLRDGVVVRH